MALDRETRREIEGLKSIIRDLRSDVRRLSAGSRTPQLSHSSIDSGALEVRDGEAVRARIGWLPDGTVGMITEGGDPVSAPTTPIVTPSLGGLRVTWNGSLSDDLAIPGDFDHMAVHVSTTSGFTPSAATYVGSIRRAGEGGMLPVVPLPYVPHYVKLVPVTTGGVQGVPSAEAAATPLQTSGIDLQADSVEAVHIQAGAVEADKLEAILALVTTIIAGIPGAARVEMDQDGLRGYNETNELIFAIDSDGNAVFSGDIVASEITGSRMFVGAAPGPTAYIGDDSGGGVQARVRTGDVQAQLAALGTQANFLAMSNVGSGSTPMAGFAATPTQVLFALDSSGLIADGKPSVRGMANATSAQLSLWSVSNSASSPHANLTANGDETTGVWASGSGSAIRIRALSDFASIRLTAPPATDPDDAQGEGYVFTQRLASDIAAVSMQSPVWSAGSGPERGKRSMLHAEGARPDRSYTRMAHAAARHVFGQQFDMLADTADTADGVVELTSVMSMASTRHRPVSSSLASTPTWTSPTTGSFVDFTSGQWQPITFKTSWSGLTEITILMAGGNPNSDASSISVGFRLSGGGTLAADLSRCALVRSLGTGISTTCQQQATYFLQLNGNTSYTLTPAYRLSSWHADRPAIWDGSLPNRITVRPQT